MAEFVQRRKEEMIAEVPVLLSHFKDSFVKRILNQREKFEYRLMRRNKQMSDFTIYITFLKSIIKKVEKTGNLKTQSLRLINQHRTRINFLYRSALKYFKHDVSLWKKYIKFLIKTKRTGSLQTVLDNALLLHGHISDELYVFAVKQEFVNVKNIQKTREMYTNGLRAHKNSVALYLEAFKCELAFSEILIQKKIKSGDEFNKDDPALNGSIAKIIFESAVENVKDNSSIFFKMFQIATSYSFSLDLSKEIKKFMLANFNKDPNYWNTLAINELTNKSYSTEKIRIKNCLDRYDEALSILDTDEMWDKYLTAVLKITSDTEKSEIYKRNLLRQSLFNAHKKNKLKPNHYIQWINKSTSSKIDEILELALKTYPNDESILEIKINKLVKTNKLSAYEVFKKNVNNISVNTWSVMVEHFINEPQMKDIFNIIFGDQSTCSNEIKQNLCNEYLYWLNKNKSLNDARNTYNKLIINSNCCNANLCNTIVTIETEQKQVDINKIRQHYTLACLQFGKTDIDLWMNRIIFELKYGSPKFVSSIHHQAITTLNNEDSDKFAEEYVLNAARFSNSKVM